MLVFPDIATFPTMRLHGQVLHRSVNAGRPNSGYPKSGVNAWCRRFPSKLVLQGPDDLKRNQQQHPRQPEQDCHCSPRHRVSVEW